MVVAMETRSHYIACPSLSSSCFGYAFFTILDFGARWLFNRIVATGFQKPIVVVGANPATAALIRLLNDNPQYGYWVRAIFNPANSPLPENLGRATIISTVEDFKKLIGEEK